MVIWITGLSGAGKTTIARRLVSLLRERREPVVMLDGDDVRAAIADPHVGHDRNSRLANAMRISRLAELVALQEITVVVSTMSLFREVQDWNREHLSGYLEVYVKVSLETLKKRHPRGLYHLAERGEAHHVVGVDLDYDEPASPDLVLENETDLTSCEELARRILNHLWEVPQRNEDRLGLL